jgi:hypothetical protein
VRDAPDVKVILETDRLLLRKCLDGTATAFVHGDRPRIAITDQKLAAKHRFQGKVWIEMIGIQPVAIEKS